MIEINEEGIEVAPIVAGSMPTSPEGSRIDVEEREGEEISLDDVDEHGGAGFMKFVSVESEDS